MTNRRGRRGARTTAGQATAASGAPAAAPAPSVDWRPSADYSLTVALTDEDAELLDAEAAKITAEPTADQVIESARRLGELGEGLPDGRTKEWIVRRAREAGLDRQTALKATLTGLSRARRAQHTERRAHLRAVPDGPGPTGEVGPVGGEDPPGPPDANTLLLRAAGLADEAEPDGRRYEVVNPVVAMRWLLDEIGQHGLSGMFRRADRIVHTVRVGEEGYIEPPDKGDDNGPATMRAVTPDLLTAELALNYTIFKTETVKGKGQDAVPTIRKVEIFFPSTAVRTALADIDRLTGLRPLKGVTHTPLVRRDGSILYAPGYDEATGFLHLPTVAVPEVPESPTPAELADAVALLRGIVDEFTWAGQHDEVNFFGAMLTPLLRELCPPPYPLFILGAHQPGSGKSKLGKVLRAVHDGVVRAEMPADEAELGKALASVLTCTTAPIVEFDNVSGVLRSSQLASVLTEPIVHQRILGSTNDVAMINDRFWMITGNNVQIGGDILRRTLWSTIDPGVPSPELRTGPQPGTTFRLKLPEYVIEHRGEILRALLIIVRAWVIAGMAHGTPAGDEYGRWRAVVRAILGHAGFPGTFAHADSAQQKLGDEDAQWAQFLIQVHAVTRGDQFTVRTLIDILDEDERVTVKATGPDGRERTQLVRNETREDLIEALPSELHEKMHRSGGARGIAKSLGRWFANRTGRWAGELAVEKVPGKIREQQIWRIKELHPTPTPAAPPAPAAAVPEQTALDEDGEPW